MRALTIQPSLRLVGGDAASAVAPMDAAARRRVAEENVAAAHNASLDPADPRWRVAMEAAGLLDGAALPPDRREQVLRTAERLGVRLFDANLIIAVVQDAARRGAPLASARATLAIIPRSAPQRDWPAWIAFGAALLAALGTTLVLISWVAG